MRRLLRDDSGNATIVAAGIIAALASLCFVVAAVGGERLAAHQARLAADLSAVAGAHALAYGEDGCDEAGRVAALNHADLTTCHPEDADIVLTARVDREEASARAGPI